MEDYSVDPKERAFLLLGTRHHQHLDGVAQKLKCISEQRMISDEITGCADLLEPISGDAYRLIDMKTWGSYACKKAMKGDTKDVSLQLNSYRIMFEELDFKVKELFVQVTVRDFTAKTPEIDGITEKMFLIPIPMMPDAEVKDYFMRKSETLLSCLHDKRLPEFCSYEERWGNRRCVSYCDVREFCPEGSKMK
jgi:hypothetical protein